MGTINVIVAGVNVDEGEGAETSWSGYQQLSAISKESVDSCGAYRPSRAQVGVRPRPGYLETRLCDLVSEPGLYAYPMRSTDRPASIYCAIIVLLARGIVIELRTVAHCHVLGSRALVVEVGGHEQTGLGQQGTKGRWGNDDGSHTRSSHVEAIPPLYADGGAGLDLTFRLQLFPPAWLSRRPIGCFCCLKRLARQSRSAFPCSCLLYRNRLSIASKKRGEHLSSLLNRRHPAQCFAAPALRLQC